MYVFEPFVIKHRALGMQVSFMQRHCGQPCRRDFITCGASVAHVSVAHSNGTQQPFCRRHFLGSLGAAWAASSFPVTASSSSAALPSVQLAPGVEISRVIKGCWQLSGGHRGDKNSDRTGGRGAIEDFRSFIEAGINTFDTADIYGPSEKLIGNFLSTCSPEEKQNCHVLTKFCCFGDSMRQARNKEFVRKAIDNSRNNLGIDALDSVQFYWHDYNIPGYIEASLHLADLKSSGAIKAIGVTNFDVVRLSEMVDAGVPIVSNQVQYSLLDTRPENGMVDYCRSQNILLLPYGTVAGGFLSNKFLDVNPREVQINTYSLSKYASVINQRGGWDWFQVLLHTLDEIGKKHGVGIAEVASKWVLDRPAVGGIIVGARNASHVNQHRSLFSFNLDADDNAAIEEVFRQGIRPSSDVYTWERGGGWA